MTSSAYVDTSFARALQEVRVTGEERFGTLRQLRPVKISLHAVISRNCFPQQLALVMILYITNLWYPQTAARYYDVKWGAVHILELPRVKQKVWPSHTAMKHRSHSHVR